MKKLWMIVLALSVTVILCACGSAAADEDMAAVEGGPDDAVVAETPEVASVDAFGVVTATKEVAISVDFNARVDKIHVQVGETVAEGAPLVNFDISELNNALNDKKRELAYYQEKLGQKNYDATKLSYDLDVANDELATLEEQFAGQEKLYQSGALSKQDYDAAKDSLNAKRNNVKNMSLSLSSAHASVSNENTEIKNTVQRLLEDIARLEEKYAAANFVNGNQIASTLKHGVVLEIPSKEGAYVDRENTVMTIVDLDSRIVTADIAEEFISKIQVGQETEIISQANPDHVYHGKISRVWGISVKKGGETIVPIEIELSDIDDALYMNFNVDVKIML
ncbi:MAG: efflux RND transporter periplasmic adaptor subunit [Clostridia bacterium]|nr:efflux RND transporter periplasmic adaptor subunit [Clostridia bacterium]